jgi:Ser/Thr protein kinase RdoA (MazF antagonist)
VVETDGGQRAFVKAVGRSLNPDAVTFHRREAKATAALPPLDCIPRLLATTEITLRDDLWAVTLLAAVDGTPPRHPWSGEDAALVFDAVTALADSLTPSPWPAEPRRDRRFDTFLTGWRQLAHDTGDPWHAAPWVDAHLPELVEQERALCDALPGDTLAHRDLRADNLLVDGRRVSFVDWPHAGNAAAFFDPALLLCDVIASGADVADGGDLDVARFVDEHRAFAGVDPSLVYAAVSALAAALHRFSLEPGPPGLPTLRSWQRGVAERLLTFTVRRHGHA